MPTNPTTPTVEDALKHLPYYAALRDYGASRWICFGTLTHAHAKPAPLQLERFRELMHAIGRENDSFGKRLHWVVRAEGGHRNEGKARSEDETRMHLHFLLADHRVIAGHTHPFTREAACTFLEDNWKFGRADVQPFDPTRKGLEYVMKSAGGPSSPSWDDTVELSPSLLTHLKEKKDLSMPLGLKRFAARRLAELKLKKRPRSAAGVSGLEGVP